MARDPLLRASTPVVLETAVGRGLDAISLQTSIRSSFSVSTRAAISSHLGTTWRNTGFLSTGASWTRVRVLASPSNAAYALALGFMEGGRGSLLLTTPWTRLLDCPTDELFALVRQAARRGWVEYWAAGDVIDLRVEALFTDDERGWCDGQ